MVAFGLGVALGRLTISFLDNFWGYLNIILGVFYKDFYVRAGQKEKDVPKI